MQYVIRALLPMLQKNCEMDKEICVHYVTYGCPKQFHIIQTIYNKPKLKGQRLSFQGSHNGLCSENNRARREDNKDREYDGSLASTSIALTPSVCKGLSVKDPAEHLQGGLKIHIMVQVPPSGRGEKKNMASMRCRVCSAHKQRKVTSFVQLVRWHFAKLCVSVNNTRRKMTEEVCKN